VAAYSGDTYYAPSTSPSLAQVVLLPGVKALSREVVISGARESHRRWREGKALARISADSSARAARRRRRRAPVGTTFSFALNVSASVRLSFKRSLGGERVGERCVAPRKHRGKSSTHRARCTRLVTGGSLEFSGHSGLDRVHFEGLLSRRHKLRPGRYTLSITASASGTQSSPPQRLRFTIVKR
jgi:hypothetical protein